MQIALETSSSPSSSFRNELFDQILLWLRLCHIASIYLMEKEVFPITVKLRMSTVCHVIVQSCVAYSGPYEKDLMLIW